MKYNKLIPELSITNIAKSLEFYQMLGFQIKYERKEKKFAFIEMDEIQFMIEECNDTWDNGYPLEYPFGNGINFSIEVSNIDEIYETLNKNNYPIFVPMEENHYRVDDKILSSKEFLVMDPDGYTLRFNQDM